MRCHCYDGWLRQQDDGTYLCDDCADVAVRSEESRDILTRQGCVFLSAGHCWTYADDAQAIEDWFNIHDVRHMAALEHFDEKKTWPEDFMPGKVYCREGWRKWIARRMAKAWMKMILKFRVKE
jgi:hypothetical protein